MNPEISGTDRPVDRLARARTLDPLAEALQRPIKAALAPGGALGPRVNDLLHGVPLRHALHPAITDVPIGAWTVVAALDALELGGARRFAAGADAALTIGLLGALGAMATGFAEWSDTAGEPRRLGYVHAVVNGGAFTAYALSAALRLGRKRRPAIGLALAGYAAVSLGAYLGGELSLGANVGVRHTAPPVSPPEDFTPVLDDAALPPDRPTRALLGEIPLLLVRTGGEIRAISAVCTHRGGPLDEGTLEDGCIRCPWHGGRFALDGAVRAGPPVFPVARFETRVREGKIEARPALR